MNLTFHSFIHLKLLFSRLWQSEFRKYKQKDYKISWGV